MVTTGNGTRWRCNCVARVIRLSFRHRSGKQRTEGRQSFSRFRSIYQEKFASAGRQVLLQTRSKTERLRDSYQLLDRLGPSPLFRKIICDVAVLVTLISSDDEALPDLLVCLAASAALVASDIPSRKSFEVRIAAWNGEMINQPDTYTAEPDFEFHHRRYQQNIMMVEERARNARKKTRQKARDRPRCHPHPGSARRRYRKREYTKPYRNEELNERSSLCER